MKKILILAGLLLAGCRASSTYVEGNSLTLGIYVPASGQLYGVQALSWLSGCRVDIPTNRSFTVSREFSSSNDYFGIVRIREKTKTEVRTDAAEDAPKTH